MQNYELEARRKQEEQEQMSYQKQRDPFQYGQQVARRRYSEIMSGLQERQTQSSRAYSDLYQQARERAVSQRAVGAPSLSGGMQAQYSDLVSAREMRELGGIGAAREQAGREIDLQRQSAFSNAELEGQQAEQFGLQRQQTQLDLIRQKNQILADKEMTNEQKAEQLQVLGYAQDAQKLLETPDEGGGIPDWILSASGFGLGALSAAKIGGIGIAATSNPIGWAVIGLAALVLGVDKLGEELGWRDGKGLFDLSELGL